MKQEDSEDSFSFQTIIEVWVFIRSAKLKNIPKQLNSKQYWEHCKPNRMSRVYFLEGKSTVFYSVSAHIS